MIKTNVLIFFVNFLCNWKIKFYFCITKTSLSYGVMVTQQILVLLFLVRIQVAQLKKRGSLLAFFILPPRSSPPRTACFAMRNKQTTLPSDISIITHTWNFNFKIRAVLKTRHQKQTINLHAHPFSVLFYPKPYPTFVLHRRYEEFKWDCARGGLHPQKWRKWKIRQDLKHRIDTKELDARFRLFLEDFGGGF